MKTMLAVIALSLAPVAAMADAEVHASGVPGAPDDIVQVIDVLMDDRLHFSPDTVTVKAGETVRFFARNTGRMKHEMVIGSMTDLTSHAEMMRKYPGMEHEEPNMITLKPGQRGGIVWKFDTPGSVYFACLVPGHMEVGMIAKVVVTE
ncbi:cupredoxin domain-containing protein [Denitromonas halophila]|uniref:Blue (type 1) copper domain-containing protein n=1 Tax=Denitromonas halophila TaxID=1629404 RepID=A0A557R3K4_9RHOO|nr:cupredoxin family protein [Denitromonas halophila]TVO59716.1 hypothetical protein FHP91_00390 [Denitromonas halophila]